MLAALKNLTKIVLRHSNAARRLRFVVATLNSFMHALLFLILLIGFLPLIGRVEKAGAISTTDVSMRARNHALFFPIGNLEKWKAGL